MNGQREDFYLNLENLQQLQKERGISDSALSKAVGKSRSWLHAVKKQKEPKVDLGSANLIAEQLNCVLQNIRDDSKTRLWNPIVIDEREKAQRLFNELLSENTALISAILEYIKSADSTQKNDLKVYVSPINPGKKQNAGPVTDQWWKYLFVSELGRVLVEELELCKDSNLIDRFNERIQEKRVSSEDIQLKYTLLKNIIREIAKKGFDEIQLDYDKETKILDSTCEACAKFLVSYSIKTTPDYELIANRYKQGKLF